MKKLDFVKKVKEALALSSIKAAEEVVDKLSAVITESVTAGEEIPLGDVGKFAVVERSARKCRNPKTGETVEVPAKKTVKFKPTSALKNKLNK